MAKKQYYETEIGRLIENQFDGRMQPLLFSYILEKGTEVLKEVTDEQIESVKGKGITSADFMQALVRTARDISKKHSSKEIMKYIKSYVYLG